MATSTLESPRFPLEVERGDPRLPGLDLWLDPHRPHPFAFISHAHADHFAPHGRVLCSTPTRRLIEARFGSGPDAVTALDFGEEIEIEGHRLRLHPAGHIPGSAMLRVECLRTGRSLLHTGDFKTRVAPGAEPIEVPRADTLIMETTFGIPKFRMPPADSVIAAIVKFSREGVEESELPVLMAYSLGKAQEILLALRREAPELRFQVHPSVAKMNGIVASLGYDLPDCEIFDPKERSPEGHVLVIPPNAGRSRAVRRLRKNGARLAMVSGWGMDPSARYRYQCDEVFPLSDHADYDDLLRFVEQVDPERVHTIHGYRQEFARDLRSRGREAWPLSGETQLELELADDAPPEAGGEEPPPGSDSTGSNPPTDPVESAGAPGGTPGRPRSEFADLVAVCEDIAATTGKKRKREILAPYLRSLTDANLAAVATFLSGKAFARGAEVRAANVGWAVIRQSLLDVTGLSLARYRRISSAQADVVRTTHLILQGHTDPRPHSLAEVARLFEELAAIRGQAGKVSRLAGGLATFHPSEGALLVGILTGDLRIGLREGLLEEALADAFGRPVAAIRSAHMLTGDIGRVAVLARENRLDEAEVTWFTPLHVMLASPEEDAAGIVSRLGATESGIWLEDKFDGIRAQLHRRGEEVDIFSRDLRPITAEFPELVPAARNLSRDVILDGEIIAWAEGRKLTFFDLQKRLGKKRNTGQGDLFLGEAVPVHFIAFDLLGIDGASCLDLPLRERRAKLDAIEFPGPIRSCDVVRAADADDVEARFNEARRRENEGLIAKDPESAYTPGRRGRQWLKLKKAMPTLDVVVVAAQQGHGKRAHVLSDYTFAIRDEESDALRVIGKAYSGLTDEEIEELTAHFEEHTLEKRRNTRKVEPDVVLEIAFDSIQPSRRHDSGLSLRFPRIKAIRHDKTPAEIDTLAYARRLAGVEV